MAKVQAQMATADDNLSRAVAALKEAEDGDPGADADTVNRLSDEATRLEDEYRQADQELGWCQQFWYEEDEEDEEESG
jgi:hypothetical protein